MEIELLLDMTQASAENLPLIERRLREWYAKGAEIRYAKAVFGSFTVLEAPHRFIVDLGTTDPITAIRELHATLYRLGVKIFIHFLP